MSNVYILMAKGVSSKFSSSPKISFSTQHFKTNKIIFICRLVTSDNGCWCCHPCWLGEDQCAGNCKFLLDEIVLYPRVSSIGVLCAERLVCGLCSYLWAFAWAGLFLWKHILALFSFSSCYAYFCLLISSLSHHVLQSQMQIRCCIIHILVIESLFRTLVL